MFNKKKWLILNTGKKITYINTDKIVDIIFDYEKKETIFYYITGNITITSKEKEDIDIIKNGVNKYFKIKEEGE